MNDTWNFITSFCAGFVVCFILAAVGVTHLEKHIPENKLCQIKFGTGHGTIITEEFRKLAYKKTKPNRIVIICEEK